MKRKQFGVEQIAYAIAHSESGKAVTLIASGLRPDWAQNHAKPFADWRTINSLGDSETQFCEVP